MPWEDLFAPVIKKYPEDNIASANACGMDGILFTAPEDLAQALEKRGIGKLLMLEALRAPKASDNGHLSSGF